MKNNIQLQPFAICHGHASAPAYTVHGLGHDTATTKVRARDLASLVAGRKAPGDVAKRNYTSLMEIILTKEK